MATRISPTPSTTLFWTLVTWRSPSTVALFHTAAGRVRISLPFAIINERVLGLNMGIEEVANPRRTLPLAMLCSLIFITAVYILMNVAYFAVLGAKGVGESIAVAQVKREVYSKRNKVLVVRDKTSRQSRGAGGAAYYRYYDDEHC